MKKTTILFIALIMSWVCLDLKAIAQEKLATKKKTTRKTTTTEVVPPPKESDGNAQKVTELEAELNQYKIGYANKGKDMSELQLKLEHDKQVLRDELAEAKKQTADQRIKDSLRLQELFPSSRAARLKPVRTLGLPSMNYDLCPSDTNCTMSLLDDLLHSLDLDFSSSDVTTRKQRMHYSELFSKLEPETLRDFFTAVVSEKNGIPTSEYRTKEAAYQFIIPLLVKRKKDILRDSKIWDWYGGGLPELKRLFELPQFSHKQLYILGWYETRNDYRGK